jgi:hypothetical protein
MQTSSWIHLVIFSALSLSTVACGGGDDDGDPAPAPMPTGGGGGGGGGAPGLANIVGNCDELNPLAHDGYYMDAVNGWEIAWFTYTDNAESAAAGKAMGTITPAEKSPFVCTQDAADAINSTYVFNAKGSGFATWGAGMGFNLKIMTDPAPPGLVDISKFTGIKFSIKVNTAETGRVRVKLVDAQTTPVARGGTCDAALGACDNNFGKELMGITVGTWIDFSIPFADLRQETWSSQMFTTGPQTTKAIGFQFQVKQNTNFDYSVDNVAFY